MKTKLLNNLGIKILSVFAAVVIWVLVVNVDDYMVTKTVSNVAITVVNEDAISQLDKVYQLEGDGVVDIIVKGPRSQVESLTAEDFVATVDLTQLSLTNSVQVIVEAKAIALQEVLSISCVENMVSVSLENLMEQQLPITVKTEGSPAEGYAISTKTSSPNMITVSGAESVIKRIKTVQVTVDVTDAKEDVSVVAKPVFLNSDGDKISAKKIKVNTNSIDATVEIVKTKEIPVEVRTNGEIASGFGVVSVDYQPTTIVVAGKEEALEKVESLLIRDIRIAGLSETKDFTVDVVDYLPDGVVPIEGNEQIMIQVVIEPLITKEFVVIKDDIIAMNLGDGLVCEISKIENPAIAVKGLEHLIKDFKLATLKPYIDVEGLGVGTHRVKLLLEDVEGISVTNDVMVNIEIKRSGQ